MRDFLFNLPSDGAGSLQSRIRRMVIGAILDGQLPEDSPLPSCRALAKQLGVARNTVVIAYQGLVDEGYVVARERSGFYVDGEIRAETPRGAAVRAAPGGPTVDWVGRFAARPSSHRNIAKPLDWQRYPYPFIYGEVDPGLFPLTAWRECSRQALSRSAVKDWTHDQFAEDDPMLVEEIRTRVLPRRGVRAAANEILITLGAQHALYLLATLLIGDTTTVGIEEPGYVDAHNICRLRGARLKPLAVDADGLVVDRALDACDYVYVTPSHQSPTTVTMPLERRAALLERAATENVVVIEDDYEPEANYVSDPTTALKSLDTQGRVIHIGSFSKALAPGLRLGYMVADPALIAEARALRPPDAAPPAEQQPAHRGAVSARWPLRRPCPSPAPDLSRPLGGAGRRAGALPARLEPRADLRRHQLLGRGPGRPRRRPARRRGARRRHRHRTRRHPFPRQITATQFLPPRLLGDPDRTHRARHRTAR